MIPDDSASLDTRLHGRGKSRALGVSSASDYVVVMDFDQNGKAGIDRDPDPAAGKTDI